MKALKDLNPKANIVAVDYDPGASEVNQVNRIKLMMSVAFRNYARGKGEPEDPALTAEYEALKEAAATETAENCGCGAGGCAAPDETEDESVCASCASAEDCDRYCGCGK